MKVRTKNLLTTLLFLLCCNNVHSMIKVENKETKATATINLLIFPGETFLLKDNSNKTVVRCIQAFLVGPFTSNNVKLLGEEDSFFMVGGTHYFKNTKYITKYAEINASLDEALSSGKKVGFPLSWLKNLSCNEDKKNLVIYILNNDCTEVHQVNMPLGMSEKMLSYFSYDMTSEQRDCFDFFKNVFFDVDLQKKDDRARTMMDLEGGFRAGDGVILFLQTKGEKPVINHCAIFLGMDENKRGLYISKGGRAGVLLIMSLRQMSLCWESNGFYYVPFKQR